MPGAGGYPIEEFLEAITAQLDQTQDALRLKAVNRPLTFALKDFNVDLKVFVEMDQAGRVMFRPAAPNEEGASTVSIGFTTITRPMIEENTISMEMANAPTLDELGLAEEERRQLARVGVRNAAQLRNLEKNAGDEGLSRHTGVNLGRIRGALNLAQPRLTEVVDPEAVAVPEAAPVAPPVITAPTPAPQPAPEPAPSKPPVGGPQIDWRDLSPDGLKPRAGQMIDPAPLGPEIIKTPERAPLKETILQNPNPGKVDRPGPGAGIRRRLNVGPEARKIDLKGANLVDAGRIPVAKLDGQKLNLLAAKPSAVSFALPQGWALGPGRLSVEMPDGEIEDFDLDGGHGA